MLDKKVSRLHRDDAELIKPLFGAVPPACVGGSLTIGFVFMTAALRSGFVA